MFITYLGGTIISLLVTGFLADRLVVRKILKNADVQDILKLVVEAKNALKQIAEDNRQDKVNGAY